ncbi:hypothetical protein TD95_002226 [Thielaviopsis punctulata]|uniref:Sas10 C-terminal domain-containing protein n=1 Tax=Thielaviopsis punctulata TaxID=72032 RepID=A0A0F4ZK78_9PEZI|nr:hypothetical protein TD95_002226 [Thielaviopsis punctulata]
MGRKRKTPQSTGPSGPREVDAADARLGPINSFEDVADDQDEYFMNQDKIMIDDRSSKRQKMREEAEAFLQNSDEEVFDYGNDDDDDDEDDDDEEEEKAPKKSKKSGKKGGKASDDEDAGNGEEEEGDERWWGSSKKEYYNADVIETEADALEEEAEAKRIQHKKLSKMADEDFMFDENEWKTAEDKTSGEEVVTEVLADAEIPDDLTPEDSLRLLSTRYPEFEYLATEFEELKPVLETHRQAAEGKDNKSLEMVQYIVLASYMAALASYFAILTSPTRDSTDTYKTIDPAELRDHEVMTALFKCREMWTRVRDIKSTKALDTESTPVNSDVDDGSESSEDDEFYTPGKTPDSVKTAKSKKSKLGVKVSKDVEDDLADLYNMPLKLGKKKKAKAESDDEEAEQGDSDFGEEDALDEKAALEKAKRKKTLRFYTSQIVQKSSRRAGAGRDAGGDMDIPYRERLKDRQARLNAEAEKRGRKYGADLDGADSDAEDRAARQAVTKANDDDEYYDMVAAAGRKKRADKSDKYAAYAAAGKADRVVEVADVGEDGKRKITYTIEKNKGLAPKRKKENRNPRVKKRLKYEEKMKKLKSMKPVFAGPGQGGYQGIKTGIKAGLIKSTKFQN